ncbi:TIGR03943 family putative permease subunit [Streptomyces chromofuscus]|uniref:TIGR03943 family protein n=1 Tax=Streptomyces chromofuscus TaxID=42881 RepID=A0A7M2T191_STRCW|nr:TIGR03943 family protein [Streptomyces chromofuscus]QOV42094.1 TIGR03943 family protein [Streptomyces chromofuscus]GGS85644.1 membrane protein [Streptomyces chromofuscus]
MNRHAQAAVLCLLGASLTHAGATDLSLRYVKSGLRPLLLLAGVVLIAAAVATVWYERRGETSGRHEPRVSWLLLLPVLALVLIAPPALGSYSAMRTGTALQRPPAYAPLPAGDPVRLGVADYASRAAYDAGRTLRDRRVSITGFVALDRSGTPYLVRMTLSCCAADARPVKVGLTGRVPPVLQPDGWLEVTGTYTPRRTRDPVGGGPIPFIEVTAARPVPAPGDPYDETWNG